MYTIIEDYMNYNNEAFYWYSIQSLRHEEDRHICLYRAERRYFHNCFPQYLNNMFLYTNVLMNFLFWQFSQGAKYVNQVSLKETAVSVK